LQLWKVYTLSCRSDEVRLCNFRRFHSELFAQNQVYGCRRVMMRVEAGELEVSYETAEPSRLAFKPRVEAMFERMNGR
jgi:hypothetical protein